MRPFIGTEASSIAVSRADKSSSVIEEAILEVVIGMGITKERFLNVKSIPPNN